MTTLTADRAGGPGRYELRDEQGGVRGRRAAGWRLRLGEIRTGSGCWPVRRRGWRQVTAGDEEHPVLRITVGRASRPEPGTDPHRVTGHRLATHPARLTRGQESIEMRLTGPSGRHCDVHVTGEWPDRDLQVLAGLFALLVRRRRWLIIISGGTQ